MKILRLFSTSVFLFLIQITPSFGNPVTDPSEYLMLNAEITRTPPSITLTWPHRKNSENYSIFKRKLGDLGWGTPIAILSGSNFEFHDLNVSPSEIYEYRVLRDNYWDNEIRVAIDKPAIEHQGTIILIIDDLYSKKLSPELQRLNRDLIGDGWTVIRHDVSRSNSVTEVRNLLKTDYENDPTNTKSALLIGHVPVPYSGIQAPDGHPDHNGAWPTDLYYADLDGNWTDDWATSQDQSIVRIRNYPGDGKFDQKNTPSTPEIFVSRIDFFNMPALLPMTEENLLKQYLDKDHNYRHKIIKAQQKSSIDANFQRLGWPAFDVNEWLEFSKVLKTSDIERKEFIGPTLPDAVLLSHGDGPGDPEGSGGVGRTSDFKNNDVNSIFSSFFGSYFIDWEFTNDFLRAPLCSKKFGLLTTSVLPSLKGFALGEPFGISNQYSENLTESITNITMGDASLRANIIAPPKEIQFKMEIDKLTLSWLASLDTDVLGYNVYKSKNINGPYEKINSEIIQTTSYIDKNITNSKDMTYMVRAVRLETTASGSYYNLSQGLIQSIHIDPLKQQLTLLNELDPVLPLVPDGEIPSEFKPPSIFPADIHNQTLEPGESLGITMHWKGGPTKEQWSPFIHFVPSGEVDASFTDIYNPTLPTTLWTDTPLNYDSSMKIPITASIGSYDIWVGLSGYFEEKFQRLDLENPQNLKKDYQTRYKLGSINIIPPTPVFGNIKEGQILSGVVKIVGKTKFGGEIKTLGLYFDGEIIGTDDAAPFEFLLDTRKHTDGPHVLKFISDEGLISSSNNLLHVTISNTNPNLNLFPIKIEKLDATNVTSHSADLTWITKIQTKGLVQCHQNGFQGKEIIRENNYSLEHTIRIENLIPHVDYECSVTSINSEGTESDDETISFKTAPDSAQSHPSIEISNIKDGDSISSYKKVEFEMFDISGIEKVGLYVDGNLVKEASPTENFHWYTSDILDGQHSIQAEATNRVGLTSWSRVLNVIIDKIPPAILQLQIHTITSSSAIIEWDTNELATSAVELTDAKGEKLPPFELTDLTYHHKIELISLKEATFYNAVLISKDKANNTRNFNSTGFKTFDPNDHTLPKISNIKTKNVATDSATVYFETDKPTQTALEINTPDLKTSLFDVGYSFVHKFNLKNLIPDHEYSITLTATDVSLNSQHENTFLRTPKIKDEIPPAVTLISPQNGELFNDVIPFHIKATDNEKVDQVLIKMASFVYDGKLIQSENIIFQSDQSEFLFNKSVLDLPDTQFTFEIYAVDSAGNMSLPTSVRLNVDHTPPTTVELGYSAITDKSAVFKLETDEPAKIKLIVWPEENPEKTIEITAKDFSLFHSIDVNSLKPNTNYTSKVKVQDAAGNEEEIEDIPELNFLTASLADNTKPQNVIISPLENSYLNKVIPIKIYAIDNLGLSSVDIFLDETKIISLTPSAELLEFPLDTSEFPDGQHSISVSTIDNFKNKSAPSITHVVFDNSGPIISNIKWKFNQEGKVNFSWNTDEEAKSDIVCETLKSISSQELKMSTTHLSELEIVKFDQTYHCKIDANDKLGNLSQSTVFDFIHERKKFAPQISEIPEQKINFGDSFIPIFLDQYVNDKDNPPDELKWTAEEGKNLTILIDDQHRAQIQFKSSNWSGEENIVVKTTDPDGLSDSRTVKFIVIPPQRIDPPEIKANPSLMMVYPDQEQTVTDKFTVKALISNYTEGETFFILDQSKLIGTFQNPILTAQVDSTMLSNGPHFIKAVLQRNNIPLESDVLTIIVRNINSIPISPTTIAPPSSTDFINFDNIFSLNKKNPLQIKFHLDHESEVQIKIVNQLGNIIKDILSEAKPSGDHEIQWMGTNNDNDLVAPGLYGIQLKAEGKNKLKKIIVVEN